jgi:hypothetical protein
MRRPQPSEYSSVRALIETVANETFMGLFALNLVPLKFEDEDWPLAWVAVYDEKIVGVIITNQGWVDELWVFRVVTRLPCHYRISRVLGRFFEFRVCSSLPSSLEAACGVLANKTMPEVARPNRWTGFALGVCFCTKRRRVFSMKPPPGRVGSPPGLLTANRWESFNSTSKC